MGTWPLPRCPVLGPEASAPAQPCPGLPVAPEQPSALGWALALVPGRGVPGSAPHAACLPQVGEEAHFPMKSTCPCNFTLYYEVATRGNIVLSGQQPAPLTHQRSRRVAPETPIRLMHLSETGEPGH